MNVINGRKTKKHFTFFKYKYIISITLARTHAYNLLNTKKIKGKNYV